MMPQKLGPAMGYYPNLGGGKDSLEQIILLVLVMLILVLEKKRQN